MKRVRYDGPGHVLRVEGCEIRRGEQGEVPDAAAEQLLASSHINVSLSPEAAGEEYANEEEEG